MLQKNPSTNAFDCSFTDYKGRKIAAWEWRPKHPKSTILLVHGFSEHSGYYFQYAEELFQENFHVAIMDLPGHGRSEGARGHIQSIKVYVRVLEEFTKKLMLSSSVFFLSHSMGGLITMLFHLIKKPKISSGIILLSPLAGVSLLMRSILYLYAQFLNAKNPDLLFAKGLSPKELTSKKEAWDTYRNDPFRLNTISPRLFITMIKNIDLLQKFCDRIELPVLVFQGIKDKIVSPSATSQMFNKLKSKDKNIFFFRDAKHELLNESCEGEVKDKILRWLNKQLTN